MAKELSGRQIGWPRQWAQRVWLRGFLPAVLLLVLWVVSMGTHLMWCGVPPVEPRADVARGIVLVNWETNATWHLIGAPTWSLGTSFTIDGTRVVWHVRRPLWDISELRRMQLKLVIKAGHVQLPLYYPVLLATALPVVLHYRRRTRLQPWQCINCRYDLRNSTGLARCPECGNTFTMTEAHTPKP